MNYKSKFSRWLIVVALLFGLVQPTTTYAIFSNFQSAIHHFRFHLSKLVIGLLI